MFKGGLWSRRRRGIRIDRLHVFFNQPIETKVENYIATETGPSARTPDEIQPDKFLTVQALFVT